MKPPAKARLPLFALFLTALLGLFGEVVLQVAFRVTQHRWLWQPAEAHRVKYVQSVADRREYDLVPGYQDEALVMSITAEGLRRTLPETPASGPGVVFLGDSVPFGWGVPDADTYPSRFQQLLARQQLGMKVINGAVPSYNIQQSLDRWTLSLARRYPAKLLILQAANDISLASYYQAEWTPELTWASLRFKLPDNQRCEVSALVHYVRSATRRTINHAAARSDADWPTDAVEHHLQKALGRFLRARAAEGMQVVVLPIDPFYYQTKSRKLNSTLPLAEANQPYLENWTGMIERLNHCLREICEGNSAAHFFDTRAIFDEVDRSRMYLDYIHLTTEGNQLLAERLFDFCVSEKLLP